MSISIAKSRQQLSGLIIAAQVSPQTITKRNKAVAVLVSADYYKRTEAAVAQTEGGFFNHLMRMRSVHMPHDDSGIPGADQPRLKSWSRVNPFAEAG